MVLGSKYSLSSSITYLYIYVTKILKVDNLILLKYFNIFHQKQNHQLLFLHFLINIYIYNLKEIISFKLLIIFKSLKLIEY